MDFPIAICIFFLLALFFSNSNKVVRGEDKAEGPKINVQQLLSVAEELTPSLDYSNRALKLTSVIKPTLNEQKHGLLCSTFIHWEDKTLDFLVNNMNHTSRYCDWLVVVYNAQDRTNLEMELHLIHLLNVKGVDQKYINHPNFLHVLTAPHKEDSIDAFRAYCDSFVSKHVDTEQLKEELDPCSVLNPVPLSSYNAMLFSKASLLMLTLELLPQYKLIWTLDSDIDTTRLNLRRFLDILSCSFPQLPLVSQALISENTQFYRYLYRTSWKNSKALATAVGFIEIQAPIFETTFLQYFILAFVVPLLPAMVVLGGDWGVDELFCSAAKEFLIQRNPKTANFHNNVCSVVLNDLAVHHLNHGVIANVVGLDIKRELNFALMKIVHQHFGPFAHDGLRYYNDPFNEGTRYKRVYRLTKNCTRI